MKVIVTERESSALSAYLAKAEAQLSSRIAAVEVSRAVARLKPALADRSDEVLGAIEFVELDDATAQLAARLGRPTVRSLDAIHLASALTLGEDLDGFVTYDRRLADAAWAVGLEVVSPA